MKASRKTMARFRRNTGRRHEGTAHDLAGENEPDDLPLLLAPRKIGDERDVGQTGVLAQRGLDQNGDAILLQPMLVRRDHARPGPAAAAAYLPAFDGEIDLVPAGIT